MYPPCLYVCVSKLLVPCGVVCESKDTKEEGTVEYGTAKRYCGIRGKTLLPSGDGKLDLDSLEDYGPRSNAEGVVSCRSMLRCIDACGF